MSEVRERLSEHGLSVKVTAEARDWLANIGYDPAFGARPLRRALQKHVESPLSMKLLAGEFGSGDIVLVDVEDQEGEQVLVFQHQEKSSDVVAEESVEV